MVTFFFISILNCIEKISYTNTRIEKLFFFSCVDDINVVKIIFILSLNALNVHEMYVRKKYIGKAPKVVLGK